VFPEETQDYNGGVSGSSETLQRITLARVSLQSFFMLKQKHYRLKKDELGKKSIIGPL